MTRRTRGSDSLDAIAFHLVMMGLRFTVLEPPELIERVCLLAGRLSEAVQSGPTDELDRTS